MTCIFIAWGNYAGFDDALWCAREFSGVPLHVISETTRGYGVQHDIRDYLPASRLAGLTARMNGLPALNPRSICRWIVLLDFMQRNPHVTWPVFCLDWDVLVFQDLNHAYAPFLNCDFSITAPIEPGSTLQRSAAYAVNHSEPLEVLCHMVDDWIASDQPLDWLNDMSAWSRVADSANWWSVGNLLEVKNGSVFDANLTDPQGMAWGDGGKKIVWANGRPHFISLQTGRLIKANALHCWGPYKNKTHDFVCKALTERTTL